MEGNGYLLFGGAYAPNDAGLCQFVGGMDPDSIRATPLCSDSVNEGYAVQPPR